MDLPVIGSGWGHLLGHPWHIVRHGHRLKHAFAVITEARLDGEGEVEVAMSHPSQWVAVCGACIERAAKADGLQPMNTPEERALVAEQMRPHDKAW
jgi:hypothetical protein